MAHVDYAIMKIRKDRKGLNTHCALHHSIIKM